jgi:D-lactate dehydrogenase (cytochrome)
LSMPNIINFTEDYVEYLKDESRKTGKADTISFPVCEEEIINTVKKLYENKTKITVQGARTGIAAGAVPIGGHILNLGKMNSITGLMYNSESDDFILCVQPGVLLADVNKAVLKKDFDTTGWSGQSLEAFEKMNTSGDCFFPPDPTETTASIGGMVSCNASGARSFHYGPTRNYVEGLHVVLSDGSKIFIRRGMHMANGRLFSLATDTGRIIHGELPNYNMPDVKNASGYYVKENMDLIDLFIGSEGTLGIISEVELRLIKKPAFTWGVMFFFREEASSIKFVRMLRGKKHIQDSFKSGLAAIEYFNTNAIKLLKDHKDNSTALSGIPDVKEEYNTAIYTEFDENSEEEIMNLIMEAAKTAELCGGKEEDTWVADNPKIMENMKLFRHALPEIVNLMVDDRRKESPSVTKLGTDMAVPDEKLEEVINMYNTDLLKEGFESAMFGHIGNNHIHVNIIPSTEKEYERGKELYMKWAQKVLAAGGTVSAEHGIGKLKGNFLEMMYGSQGIKEMMALRNSFDPCNILNTGNLFNSEETVS